MNKCNASERKKIIFLYLTALSLRAPGEGVICRGGVGPPMGHIAYLFILSETKDLFYTS